MLKFETQQQSAASQPAGRDYFGAPPHRQTRTTFRKEYNILRFEAAIMDRQAHLQKRDDVQGAHASSPLGYSTYLDDYNFMYAWSGPFVTMVYQA